MTLPNILETVQSLFTTPERRRRNVLNASAEVRTESLEQRALLTLIGAEVSVANQFSTGNPTSVGAILPFGEPASGVVENRAEPEFSQFVDQYDIDISSDSISMIYNLADNPTLKPTDPFGIFDTYVFSFDGLAPNETIVGATVDPSHGLAPSVEVSGNMVMVTIGPDQSTGVGQNALINLDIQETSPVSLDGKQVTVSQTLQANLQTGGVEAPVGSDESATIVDGTGESEFSATDSRDFVIDIDSQSIEITFNGGPSSLRTLQPGTFERFYLNFELEDNEFISSAVLDSSRTLAPVVRVQGHDTVMIELGPGTQLGPGANALIDLQIDVVGSDVSGRIWQDLNNDGVKSASEVWLNGFEVQLNDEGGSSLRTAVSRNIDLNGDGLINYATEAGIYLFEGVQTGRHTVVQVPRDQWQQSSPSTGSDQILITLRDSLGLMNTSRDFFNYSGMNEKWILGSGSTWYFITPDGALNRWDGASSRTSLVFTTIQVLDVSVYNDTSLLTNASTRSENVANVTSPNPVTGLHFGNYLAPPATFFVTSTENNNTVNFQWHPAELLPQGTMQIWVANANTGRRFEVTSGHLDENFLSDGPNDGGYPEGRYRAWARIEYSPGVFSAWSQSQEFEFFHDAIPNPITAGLDAGIDATPTVQWAAVPGAVSYSVRVDGGVYLADGITSLSHRIERSLAKGDHDVSFRANYANGSRTQWSAPQTLTITGRPDVQVNGNIVSWAPVTAATQYELWVDRIDSQGNRLARQVVYAEGIQDLSFTLPNIGGGRYSVWVRAIRAEANSEHYSFWSNRVEFQIFTINEPEEFGEQLLNDVLVVVLPNQLQADEQHASPADDSSPQPVEDVENRSQETAEATDEASVEKLMAELSASRILDELS